MGLLKDADGPYLTIAQTAAASVSNAPAASFRLFVDTDGLFKLKDDAGTVFNVGDGIIVTWQDLLTAGAPADPSSGYIRLYSVTGDILAYRDSSGTENQLTQFPGYAIPTVSLGTAGATGTAPTVMRSDATIVAFTGTAPGTGAFGASSVTGSSAYAAHADHGHPWPAQQTAIADTTGDTLPQLEDEVNKIKAALRAVGLIAT